MASLHDAHAHMCTCQLWGVETGALQAHGGSVSDSCRAVDHVRMLDMHVYLLTHCHITLGQQISL